MQLDVPISPAMYNILYSTCLQSEGLSFKDFVKGINDIIKTKTYLDAKNIYRSNYIVGNKNNRVIVKVRNIV